MAFRLLEKLKAAEAVTSVTNEENHQLQRKALLGLAVTDATHVTDKNIATLVFDKDNQGQKPDLAQTNGDCVFNEVTKVTQVTALQGNGLRCNLPENGEVTAVTAALADSENQAVKVWLADKLATSVQLADVLHREGELMGFSAGQLEAARLAIGGRISSMTGNVFWWPSADAKLKLAAKIAPAEPGADLDSTRKAIT